MHGEPVFLELSDAVVLRAGKPILSVDSFRLAAGEHVALLGPNGSGKSTFVSLITREVFPLHRDAAPVRFKGRDRVTLAEVKQCLGVVSATMQDQITVHLPVVDVVAGGLFGALGIRCGQTMPIKRALAFALWRRLRCWGSTIWPSAIS